MRGIRDSTDLPLRIHNQKLKQPAISKAAAPMGDADPQAWLADVLVRIAEHPASRLDELLFWNWREREGLLSQAT